MKKEKKQAPEEKKVNTEETADQTEKAGEEAKPETPAQAEDVYKRQLMDPVADKLMTIMALFCFYVSGLVDWLFLAIVILKELAMIVGGYVLLTYRIVVYSKMCGKVAACLFYLAIVMTFFPQVWPWNTYVLYAALALMVYSFFFYLRDGIRQLRQRKREGKTLKGQQKQPKGQK